MRGALYALRVAMKHRLLLFIDWEGPFDLTGRLEPAHVDWRPPPRGAGGAGGAATQLGYKRAAGLPADGPEFNPLPEDNKALVELLYGAIMEVRQRCGVI